MSIGMSRVLRMVDGKPGNLLHWCNGCKAGHVIDIHAISRDGHVVGWDGSFDKPTIGEPIRIEHNGTVCEYILRAGTIAYFQSCTHHLAGKVMPMPDFPA